MMKKLAILNDIQLGFEEPPVLKLALKFLKWFQPHWIDLDGDIQDCYSFSRYDKDPLIIKKAEEEVELSRWLYKELKKITPHIEQEEGNHERRFTKLIHTQAPALAGLRGVTFEDIFGLHDCKIKYRREGRFYGRLYVTHGSIVRKHSAYTAKAHFDKYGVSVIHGHTHRGGSYMHTNLGGAYEAYENFCLCTFNMPYLDSPPDWQHGFSVVYVDNDGSVDIDQIRIRRDSNFKPYLMYGGKRFV